MFSQIIQLTPYSEPYPYELIEAYHVLRQEIYRPTLATRLWDWVQGKTALYKLQAIYDLTDQLTAHIATQMVCQKGCSHCCRVDIKPTEIETQYIDSMMGLHFLMNEINASRGEENGSRCRFLTEAGTCSIYVYRPFTCRTLFARDSPLFCEDGQPRLYPHESDYLLSGLHEMLMDINKPLWISKFMPFLTSRK